MATKAQSSKDQITGTTQAAGPENKPEAKPDPDAALRAQLLAALAAVIGSGVMTQADAERFAESKIREARATREAEAIEAHKGEIVRAINGLLKPLAADLRKAMDLGYDLGYGNLAITIPVDAEGNRVPGKLTVDLVSPVGVRRAIGGGQGRANSGEQWKVSGPGVDEIVGSPSTAAQRVLPQTPGGKPQSVNGRAWWGIPQDTAAGHKVSKTYKGSIFTIERLS